MAQQNKDERAWVCFEMARVQNACQKSSYHPQELQKIQAAYH